MSQKGADSKAAGTHRGVPTGPPSNTALEGVKPLPWPRGSQPENGTKRRFTRGGYEPEPAHPNQKH